MKHPAAPLRTVCQLFPIARRVPVTEDVVFPGAFAALRTGNVSNPSPARFQAAEDEFCLSPKRDRTCERGGGKGPCAKRLERGLSFRPARAGPTRRRFASARGAQDKKAAPSGAHRQMRGTERVHSPAPHPLNPSSGEHEKRAENRRRFPPSLRPQDSSSIPPRTVWTTRFVRCAGRAL